VKDVYPDTKLINYCEFFYRSTGQDFNFDPEFAEKPGAEWNLRSRNAIQLLGLDAMDAGISPMAWQAKTFPAEYAKKISVIHEGVDTNVIKPDPKAGIVIKDKNLTLTAKNEVITFVSRNLEPYRGFHIFMRALPELLAQRPNAHVIIIGGDGVSYGKTLLQGTYRQLALKEVGGKIDHSRVHFIGKVPYIDYLRVLQISTAHVYLTYPFVLSWSMLEAMAAGCLIIGSRTPPVEEVIKHGQNGLLVDFFSPSELVKTICSAVRRKDRHQNLREEARKTVVDKYNFERVCLPKHLKLLGIK
jgi:glycosyltransferase involved in cell wall biosynthesis